jgi:tetratricopeptide (TPR) repeat protein
VRQQGAGVARRQQGEGVIEEFESGAERLAEWIGRHLVPVVGGLVLVLVLAAAWGGWRSWTRSQEEDASNALHRTRTAYLKALGAGPTALEDPELANPKAAEAIREEYLAKFRAVADEHRGTVAGTLALFEMADLLEKLGRPEEMADAWQAALDGAAPNPILRGLLLQRVAAVEESRGDFAAAAAAHERAAEIEAFPLRHWALLEAARCQAAAGDPARALALFDRVSTEAPDLPVPAHLRVQFRELRAVHGAAVAPPAATAAGQTQPSAAPEAAPTAP